MMMASHTKRYDDSGAAWCEDCGPWPRLVDYDAPGHFILMLSERDAALNAIERAGELMEDGSRCFDSCLLDSVLRVKKHNAYCSSIRDALARVKGRDGG